MKTRYYLLIALGLFAVTVVVGDVFAAVTIAGRSLGQALGEHLDWWRDQTAMGFALMIAPFVALALVCGWLNDRGATWKAASLFLVAMAVLGWGYFDTFQQAQHALEAKRWTASGLVWLFPIFLVGPAVVGVAGLIAIVLALIGRQQEEEAW